MSKGEMKSCCYYQCRKRGACCNTSGEFIPPIVIFESVRKHPEFKESLPPGSIVAMSESGYINENLFLAWLNHFNIYKTPGRVLIVLDNHSSHVRLQALEYFQMNEMNF